MPHISSTPLNQGAPTYPYFAGPLKLYQVSISSTSPLLVLSIPEKTPRYTFFGFYKDCLIWTWKYISKPGEHKGHEYHPGRTYRRSYRQHQQYSSPPFGVSAYPYFSIPLRVYTFHFYQAPSGLVYTRKTLQSFSDLFIKTVWFERENTLRKYRWLSSSVVYPL